VEKRRPKIGKICKPFSNLNAALHLVSISIAKLGKGRVKMDISTSQSAKQYSICSLKELYLK